MPEEITQFDLPKNSYAAFDAQSMRDLIIDRLNNNSATTFTDQNYEGSNLNAIIDVIAYSFHTLLFYLNQTSSESMFSDSQLYENMNRIVKLIDYKPIGRQSSIVPMILKSTESLSTGYFTLPKFSFVTSNGITYSTTKDITFRKVNSGAIETLTPIDNTLFFEGKYKEYPLIPSVGENFETVNLLPGAEAIVDHFSIKVYVKERITNKWFEYERVPSLYLKNSNDRAFECRFNQNKNYEIKFGNNVNGRRLVQNEQIAIYYISSSGSEGQITKNNFSGSTINIYNTTNYNQIFADTKDTTLSYVTIEDSVNINVTNEEASTDYSEEESVEEIRSNAPKFFSSEYKLITKDDYKNFVVRNYSNFVYDVVASNNSDYVDIFQQYLFEDLGLNSYHDYTNALYNQFQYADSFNVNNLYLTIVPKFKKSNSIVKRSNYLTSALKNEILFELRKYKLLNGEVCFLDPVYLAVDIAVKNANEPNKVEYKDNSSLVILRNNNTISNDDTIKNKVVKILQDYFSNSTLGQIIDMQKLNSDILSIPGVDGFYTVRNNVRKDSLSLSLYNPIYNGRDVKLIDSNLKLKYFQIPYIEDIEQIKNKISVTPITKSKSVEY